MTTISSDGYIYDGYVSGIKTSQTYSPLWKNPNLPRDRATINAWARSMYVLDATIHRIISQHSLILSNSFTIEPSKSKKVNDFFDEQFALLNFPAVLEAYYTEYLILGELILYLELDEHKKRWSNIIIQNPDYVIIKRSAAIIDNDTVWLRPDEKLRQAVFSEKPEDIQCCRKLNADIVRYIKDGQNIPLDSFNTVHMARRVSPYEVRGTTFLISLFSTMSEKPSNDREIISEALFDPTFYQDKAIGQEMVLQRYTQIAYCMSQWIIRKLITPIAKMNAFTEVPTVSFDKDKLRASLGLK